MTLNEDPRGDAGVVDEDDFIEIVEVTTGEVYDRDVPGLDAEEQRRRADLQRRNAMNASGGSSRSGSTVKGVVARTLAMSSAAIGAMMAAGKLHGGSPWAGINTMPSGLPFLGRKASRFDPRLAAAGIGTVIAGTMVIALLQQTLSRSRIGRNRIASGALASLGSVAADRFLMRRTFVPSLKSDLGIGGMVLMYGAIGLAAAALAHRR
jgi:hypothetical protein